MNLLKSTINHVVKIYYFIIFFYFLFICFLMNSENGFVFQFKTEALIFFQIGPFKISHSFLTTRGDRLAIFKNNNPSLYFTEPFTIQQPRAEIKKSVFSFAVSLHQSCVPEWYAWHEHYQRCWTPRYSSTASVAIVPSWP